MELSEKELQELKDKKISIEALNDRYFNNSQYKIEVDNIRKLLNENICSFQQIVNKCKSIKDEDDDPCLYKLLNKKELLKELIEDNRLNKEDLKYLLNKIDNTYELRKLNENMLLFQYLIDNELFKELVDKFKSINYTYNRSCLYKLLRNTELFKELIQNTKLNKEDMRYLLNRIDRQYELEKLCVNASLVKCILNEFVLNKELVDKFNTMIEKDEWCENHNIHTAFELINFHETHEWTRADDWHERDEDEIDQESLELNELNKYTYSFDLNEDQKLELIELIQNNEITKNRLIQIIDNNLESNYDFGSLMNYLKKKEKKNMMNI